MKKMLFALIMIGVGSFAMAGSTTSASAMNASGLAVVGEVSKASSVVKVRHWGHRHHWRHRHWGYRHWGYRRHYWRPYYYRRHCWWRHGYRYCRRYY